MAPSPSLANPQGGTVAGGSAAIAGAGNTLTVRQTTNRAIVNWHSFSIGAGQTTRIIEPSSASAILNRVTGGDPSVLLGRLQSNGQVYLINPNGIMVGPNGVIDTRGGFVASTLDVPDAAFQRGGSLAFSGGSTASITNLGTIKTTSGDVALIALHVVNGGTISAPDGQALLAGGNEVLYVPDGDSSVLIRPAQPPGGASVDNSGRIAAASAQLKAAGSPYALAVNNTGSVEATGMATVGGRLVLDGGDGDVENGGTLTAPGGTARLTGGRVAVTGSVDVSAPAGGGSIVVEGRNAAAVTPTGSLAANATRQGDGGHIRLISQGATNFAGAASAAGGPRGGNGGTAEISGRTLGVTGTVDLKAPRGKAGSLLFDPTDIDIEPGTAPAPGDLTGGLWSFSEDPGSQTIGATTIVNLLNSGNLTLQATGSITVNGAISSSSANTLEFDSPTITISQPISLANGNLVFTGKNGGQAPALGISLTSAAPAAIAASGIDIDAFSTIGLSGAVQANLLTVGNTAAVFGQSSFSATNSGNAVGTLFLNGDFFGGDVGFAGTGALAVEGQSSANSFSITATGDLTMSSAKPTQLASNGGQITLASTGGAFINNAGSGVVSGTGREVIYSATDAGSFTQGGLGFPQYNPVAFGSDPAQVAQVVYIAHSTALPALAITADDLARTYGATGPTFTFNGGNPSLPGLAVQPQVGLLQGSTPVANSTGLAAGTYTIVPSGAISLTAALSFVDGTFTVNPAPITVTAATLSRTYGASNPALTDTITTGSLFNGDTLSGALATSATTASGVGSYPITQGTLAASSNYTLTYDGASLTVTPAPLTITADAQSRAYGASNPALNFSITSGSLLNGDTLSGALAATATTTSNVGSYPITQGTLAATPNYALTYDGANLTVTPAPLTVTANAQSRAYGASNPALTFSITTGSLLNGDTLSGALATTAAATSNVGVYGITQGTLAAGANYTLSYDGANLTVTPAALTITANATRTYGAALPTTLPAGDFAGFVNGDTVASLTMQPTLATSATAASSVGSYALSASGAADPNYTIGYVAGNLTVTPAPLTITANAGKVYGAALPTALPAGDYAGFVNGDTAASLTAQPTLATSATAASNVGSYALSASGAADPNYAIGYVAGNLTVTPAPLTITANATKVYGAPVSTAVLPAGDFVGFVNGDTVASLTTQPTIRTLATASSPVGSSALTNVVGAFDPNYAITVHFGTMTVTPAPLLITADDASRVYGSTNVSFGAAFTGLVNGDTSSVVSGLTVGTNAVIGAGIGTPPHLLSGVGTYSLFPSGASASNYSISYANGTLTITPAALIVTANNASKTYGLANPSFSASASGFVNGDSPSLLSGVQFFTPATSASGVGNYAIDVSGGSAGPNYQLLYLPGSLTVTPAPLTITALDASRLYGQANPTFLGTVGGLVNGDSPSIVTGLTFATLAGTGASVGTYPIAATQATASAGPNYALHFVDGTLTINPAPLTITADNAVILINNPLPNFTGTFSGLIPGEPKPNGGFGFATTVTTTANAGTFPINLTGSNPNYTVTFNPGKLSIAGNATILTIEEQQIDPTLTMAPTQPTITTTQTLAPTPTLNVNNSEQTLTVYGVNDPGLLLGPEADTIIQSAIKAGWLSPDIYALLSTNPAAAQAAALPFLYSELDGLLGERQSSWTPAQTTFVNNFINFINQQKQEAALVAENEYATWWAQQQASETAQMTGLSGPTWIMMSSMLASNPPIPPDSILQDAQSGFAMTGQQGANYTAISANTAKIDAAIQTLENNAGSGVAAAGIVSMDIMNYAGVADSMIGKTTPTLGQSLFKLSSKLGKAIFPQALSDWVRDAQKAGEITKGAKEAQVIEETTEYMSETLSTAKAVAKVAQLAGPVTEIFADLAQIGVSAVQYSQLASYNSAFNAAIAADNTPVTIASLKAMNNSNSTQVYDYLTNMLAGGNTAPPVMVAPNTPTSVYESPPMPTMPSL